MSWYYRLGQIQSTPSEGMDYDQYLSLLTDRYPDMESFRDHIEKVLNHRAQRPADYSRLRENSPEAGVLLALAIPKQVVENGKSPIPYLHIIYEKRSDYLKNHPGQMAFPGGTLEEIDRDPRDAAFREAQEEVGISPDSLDFVAYMDEFVAISSILVHPVVAWLVEDVEPRALRDELTKKYSPKTEESTATVVMPLSHLLNPKYYRNRPYNINGKQVGWVRYFDTTEIRPNDNIWGLTASMTRRFLDEIFPDNLLPDELDFRTAR